MHIIPDSEMAIVFIERNVIVLYGVEDMAGSGRFYII